MKPNHLIACAALALAACGQTTAPTEEAPAAPQSLMDQVASMSAEQRPVFAYQQLIAYQQAHPESQPPCTSIRGTEWRGEIPADVAPDSIYAPYVGAAVYSVQCGPQLTATRLDPNEHWLVIFAPDATEAAVVNCSNGRNGDNCPAQIPRSAAAPATP